MLLELENKRLACCAELLADGGGQKNIAADIGADHGYLACYLVRNGICKGAIAADINERPLAGARRTIEENGLSDKVKAVLSDGLDNVSLDGVTDIICAGMGGELIGQIILRCDKTRQARLILQPMTKANVLRRTLYENGFFIEKEVACRDGDFVYTVMRAVYSPKQIDYPCDERYLYIGRLKCGQRDADEYIRISANRLKKAACGMRKSSADKMRAKADSYMCTARSLLEEIGETL